MILLIRRNPLDRALIIVLIVLCIAGLLGDHQKFFFALGISAFMRIVFWIVFAEGEHV